MKFICSALVGLLFLRILNGYSQSFVNLNLQSANVSSYPPSSFRQLSTYVPITNAIPGWTGYIGTNLQTSVAYDNLTTGSVDLAILDTNGAGAIPNFAYTVLLYAGFVGSPGPGYLNISIAETGLIPLGANSILFYASYPYPGATSGWQVSIDGEVIPVTKISAGENAYNEYAADISAFAGQDDTLMFIALAGTANLQPGNLSLAGMSFSSNPVPEPGEFALTAFGVIFLGLRHWRKFSK